MRKIRTIKEAHAHAMKLWGKSAMVSDGKVETSSGLRDAASERLRVLRAEKPEIRPIEEWPEEMTLGTYRAELKAAQARRRAWREQENAAICEAVRYRYSVGVGGLWFLVKGQGDTWEAAFEAAERRA